MALKGGAVDDIRALQREAYQREVWEAAHFKWMQAEIDALRRENASLREMLGMRPKRHIPT
jgi:cell shape-determining protein MreC